MESGKSGKVSFQITGTQGNLSAHQSNQTHNGKISKAVPMTFKIHRTWYNEEQVELTDNPLDLWERHARKKGVIVTMTFCLVLNISKISYVRFTR